jgi:hypothetical protein
MDSSELLGDVKKPSSEWIKEVGYEVLDPDGWDRSNFQYSWYEEDITYQEFQKRLLISTVKRKFKK